jgi:hypothetical protein
MKCLAELISPARRKGSEERVRRRYVTDGREKNRKEELQDPDHKKMEEEAEQTKRNKVRDRVRR